jgi:hypothetical protein
MPPRHLGEAEAGWADTGEAATGDDRREGNT